MAIANISGSRTDMMISLNVLEFQALGDELMNQAEIEAKTIRQMYMVSMESAWGKIIDDLKNFDDPDYVKNGGKFGGVKTKIQRVVRESTKGMVAQPVEQVGKGASGQLFFWELGIVRTDHCDDCYRHSRMGAKTRQGWLDLGRGLPRWGMTECNIGCRCMLRPAGKGGGTTKQTTKAVKSGKRRTTKGLGKSVDKALVGSPISKAGKKIAKDTTNKVKSEIKEMKAKAESKRLTEDEIVSKTAQRACDAYEKFCAKVRKDPKYKKWHPEYKNQFTVGTDEYERRRVSWLREDENMANRYLTESMRVQGKLGKPKVVSEKEFNKRFKGDEVHTRGTAVPRKQAESIIFGKENQQFIGKGIYGDGIYSAYGKERWGAVQHYTGGTAKGHQVKFAIDKSAKTITFNDATTGLKKDVQDWLNTGNNRKKVSAWREKQGSYKFTNPEQQLKKGSGGWAPPNLKVDNIWHDYAREYFKYHPEQMHMLDVGMWASTKGYDVINVEHHKFNVVLNRSKMIIVDTAKTGERRW